MYKKSLHTLLSKYCSNVVLLLYCSSFIFKTLHKIVFFASRQNWSKAGRMGVGEQKIFHLRSCFTSEYHKNFYTANLTTAMLVYFSCEKSTNTVLMYASDANFLLPGAA